MSLGGGRGYGLPCQQSGPMCMRDVGCGLMAVVASIASFWYLWHALSSNRRRFTNRNAVVCTALILNVLAVVDNLVYHSEEGSLLLVCGRLLLFVQVCFYFGVVAVRILKHPSYVWSVMVPLFGLAVALIVLVLILGLVGKISAIQCQQRFWVLLSASSFVLSVCLVVSSFYIISAMNAIHMASVTRNNRKFRLTVLVLVNVATAFFQMLHSMYLFMLFDQTQNVPCELPDTLGNAILEVMVRLTDSLLPTLCLIWVLFRGAAVTRVRPSYNEAIAPHIPHAPSLPGVRAHRDLQNKFFSPMLPPSMSATLRETKVVTDGMALSLPSISGFSPATPHRGSLADEPNKDKEEDFP
eukprot:gnl/Spiro4/5655_TR2888_c0_g1_i1.p1 gnl/Spiro4/5655_TR2888_c0_g1~~gnl/Spiro4/5655_TR2888_c0_g1_i1.p1  ORF type:complete len:354 (-),score=44.98 gnl/Spiro4/5655_TR2888_c0_g1_i1:77-1138(-)